MFFYIVNLQWKDKTRVCPNVSGHEIIFEEYFSGLTSDHMKTTCNYLAFTFFSQITWSFISVSYFWICFILVILHSFLHLLPVSPKFHIQTCTFSLISSLTLSETSVEWEITQIYTWGENFIVFHQSSHLCSGKRCLKILKPNFENLSNNNIFSLINNGRNYNRKY